MNSASSCIQTGSYTSSMVDINSPRAIFAFIYTGVVSASVIFIAPLLVGGLIGSRGLTQQQAGLMVSLETAFISLAALLGAVWINRIHWQQVTKAAALLLLLGNLGSIASESVAMIALNRCIAGFGAGSFIALTYGALAKSAGPDRNFGLFSMGQLGYAALSLWTLPRVLAEFGVNGIFVTLSLLSLGALLLFPWVPGHSQSDNLEKKATDQTAWVPAGLMLAAIFVFLAAQSSIWTYAERMGVFAGFTLPDVGFALAAGAAAGFAGAGCATWITNRYGRLAPITLMVIIKFIALYGLQYQNPLVLFIGLICALKFTWNFLIPFQLGLLAEIDHSGRAAVISSFVTGMGLSAGAALAALTVEGDNYGAVLMLSATCCLLSYLLMLAVMKLQSK